MSVMVSTGNKFAVLLLQYQPKLQALLHCLVFEKQAIPDLLQEINVILLNKEKDYDPDRDFFLWAAGIARGVVMSFLRDKKRNRIAYDNVTINQLIDSAEALIADEYDSGSQYLRQCMDELPQGQRNLLELRYYQGLSAVEIGVRLERKPNTVSQIIHRIRLIVIQCIQKKQNSSQRESK